MTSSRRKALIQACDIVSNHFLKFLSFSHLKHFVLFYTFNMDIHLLLLSFFLLFQKIKAAEDEKRTLLSDASERSSSTRKLNPCPFCGKLYGHLAKHVLSVHKNHHRVESIPAEGQKRQEILHDLLVEGRLKFNKEIGTKGVIRYQKKDDDTLEDAWPCRHCGELYYQINRHIKICPKNNLQEKTSGYGKVNAKKFYFNNFFKNSNNEEAIPNFVNEIMQYICNN